MSRNHFEYHRGHRIGWLRAAVLGANDGTISIASLIVGIAAAGASRNSILMTGVAALVASTMSMAAGEYVSVQSQADTEKADIAREKAELDSYPEAEAAELTAIYVERGLSDELAAQVSKRMMEVDALGTHAREELGITDALRAQPLQAAFASAIFFAIGAVIPLIAALISTEAWIVEITAATALLTLVTLGSLAAYAGGAPIIRGAVRVAFWGALALAITTLVGRLFGIAV